MSAHLDTPEPEQASFDTLCTRIVAGQRLPSLVELLRGAPFFKDDLWPDADQFARQIMMRLDRNKDPQGELLFALAELTVAPSTEDYLLAADRLDAAQGTPAGNAVQAARSAVRCRFYAAVSGHPGSVPRVAAYALAQARSANSPGQASDQWRGAVAWMMAALGVAKLPPKWTREAAVEFVRAASPPDQLEPERAVRMVGNRISRIRPEQTELEMDTTGAKDDPDSGDELSPLNAAPTAVVCTAIGNAQSNEGKRIAAEFNRLSTCA